MKAVFTPTKLVDCSMKAVFTPIQLLDCSMKGAATCRHGTPRPGLPKAESQVIVG
ncbi:hypothetical protein DPMN_114329 [Dreissena polymorpha]|uniref:Uncharacterized protein n=1 Tax=Dreissena polymorpha TaxID=45954 RepID=A0A9D4QSC9_DREPO|nr:hypothetical protein DPMN_114329 [Dreissena polymorpha]